MGPENQTSDQCSGDCSSTCGDSVTTTGWNPSPGPLAPGQFTQQSGFDLRGSWLQTRAQGCQRTAQPGLSGTEKSALFAPRNMGREQWRQRPCAGCFNQLLPDFTA
jgi:hypothetical protein